jgi:hypothetical protein
MMNEVKESELIGTHVEIEGVVYQIKCAMWTGPESKESEAVENILKFDQEQNGFRTPVRRYCENGAIAMEFRFVSIDAGTEESK